MIVSNRAISLSMHVLIDGDSLTADLLVKLSQDNATIDLSPEAWDRVKACRSLVTKIQESPQPVYGINTGFGNFATVSIPSSKLAELQLNLITSHAAGVGSPLTVARTKMLLALRINVLAKGYSGISPETMKAMIDAFNKGCLSWVPEQGTVGASGDLAPLSHLALGLLGQGKMWDPTARGYRDAADVLKDHGLKPIELGPKEGLAMINGTQFITSLGAEALVRAKNLIFTADVIGALTLEVLKGTPRAFDPKIHAARPHPGQLKCAERLRRLLNGNDGPSSLFTSHQHCNRVQDAYSLRCMPQIHGVCADTVDFVERLLTTELNSATDNPMLFPETGESISGGNFHGEYPAKALDYLAIGIHELASVSERRIERLVNPALSGLPAFLVANGGLHSGFMIAHCTAASLVSENKVLTHPSSVDSISTSAAKEDHVSMGGMAARKALQVVENVEKVLAIELLAACQGLEFLRPLETTKPLENVYKLVREWVQPWTGDRFMAPDIEAVWKLVKSGTVKIAVENSW